METSRHPFNYRRALGQTDAKVYRIHPCEKALIWVTALILIFQPWAMGGMRLWSQIPVGILAVIAFLIALLPRNYTDEHHAGPAMRLRTWPKLLRFPIFWLGLIYFGIILIQIANPAWQYVSNGRGWWMVAIDHITWLPHGVADTPIQMMNGWRTILIQGAAWLLVCALWIGITRRKSVRLLLTTIALNGVALALVTLAQKLTGTTKLLWMFDAGAAKWYFAGSFFYKNHGGAFLLLILSLCLGLAWWHRSHAEHRLQKSHPGGLFVILAIPVLTGLMFTYARATTALGGVLLFLVTLAFAIHCLFRRSTAGPPRIVTAVMAVMGISLVALCLTTFNTDKIWSKFQRLADKDVFSSITSRQLATQATVELAKTQILTGHGVGSYRFLFPKYQQRYPEIWTRKIWNGRTMAPRRLFWEHAHNDYAEYLAEMGLIGAVLALGGVTVLGLGIRRYSVWSQPYLIILLAGPGLVAISAYVDFPMHNPAILASGLAITALTLKWAALSRRTP